MSRELPTDWRLVRIGEIGNVRAGTTPPRKSGTRYFASNGHPWVKTLDLNDREVFDTGEHLTDAALEETSCTLNPPGTVLVAMYGGFNQIGRSGVLRIFAATNQAVAGIQLDSNKCDPNYLNHCLVFLRPEWRRVAASSRKDPNITKQDLLNFHVPLPPLREQLRIAKILSSMDEVIQAAQAFVEQTRAVKRGVLQRLLTKGIGCTRFKQTEVGEIPEHWDVLPLGALVESLEAGVSVNSENRNIIRGEVGVLKTSCVSEGVFRPQEHKAVLQSERSRVHTSPKADHIIISRMNTPALVGASAYVAEDYPDLFLPDRLWLLRACVNTRWLSFVLGSDAMRSRLGEIATGTSGSMKNISKARLLDLRVAVPPAEEQESYAATLDAIEKSLIENERAQLQSSVMKAALMSDLLTGRKRVSDGLLMAAE